MFFIRCAQLDDQSTLHKLAKMVHFINLPADGDIIAQKIRAARAAFRRVAAGDPPHIGSDAGDNPGGLSDSIAKTDLFMFVLDDTGNSGCLGTSQLIAQMGGPHNPNLCFKLEVRHKYSESLKTGTNNLVAQLHEDTSGPTEIGGLILQPSFRGHPEKLGRLLSLVRFHFIGRYRERFRDEVLGEMMAPITADGHNLLWDYLGRRFVPLSYEEADRFCQYSREFIKALLPTGDIHISLLPPHAREVIGRVGPDTVPARRMLEKLGFVYNNLVDPFDGGPFLRAVTNDIWVVRETYESTLGEPVAKSKAKQRAIVSVLTGGGEFRAIEQPAYVASDGRVSVIREAMATLGAKPGDACGVTVMPAASKSRKAGAVAKARVGKPTDKKVVKNPTSKAGGKPATSKAAKKPSKKTPQRRRASATGKTNA